MSHTSSSSSSALLSSSPAAIAARNALDFYAQSDWLQRISDCVLGYRLRHAHDHAGGTNASYGNVGNGSNGGNGNGPTNVTSSFDAAVQSASSPLSRSHEEALFIRLAWLAEQTQILLGNLLTPSSPSSTLMLCDPICCYAVYHISFKCPYTIIILVFVFVFVFVCFQANSPNLFYVSPSLSYYVTCDTLLLVTKTLLNEFGLQPYYPYPPRTRVPLTCRHFCCMICWTCLRVIRITYRWMSSS